jgi:hyperosmotically inducible periplasmic protein
MNRSFKTLHLGIVALAVLTISSASIAARAQDQSTKPDNSAQNKDQNQTAQNQSNVKSDRELTAKVRKAIIADKDLSTYAHNIKIITQSGTVILKGPVKSDEEKQKIKSDAANAAAGIAVIDQLTVKQ